MTALEQMACYVPRRILHALAQPAFYSALPAIDRFEAVTLFADITGFTELTDRLGRRGPEGTEQMARILDEYFRGLLAHVARHGGDVLKMAGDAMVVVWETSPASPPAETVARAVQCALEIQAAGHQPAGAIQLTVRIGIGVGEAMLYYVGGVDNRWEILPLGEPFRQMGEAEGSAHPGEVVVSPEAWGLLETMAQGEALPSGCARIVRLLEPVASAAVDQVDLPVVSLRGVEGFAPRPMRWFLQSGAEKWLADMRPVTSLFVFVPARSGEAPTLERLQELATLLQDGVHRYEGNVIGAGVDEKGLSILALFGLPPRSHEDEPQRAVQAAMALRASMGDTSLRVGFGVATGRVFCGTIGDDARRDYAALGSVINLAARLSHVSGGAVFCDEPTCQAASRRMHFAAERSLHLKGFAEPVPVYVPTGHGGLTAPAPRMVGHVEEFALLLRAADALRAGSGSLFLVEGEAGLGKSTLLREWSRLSAREGLRVLKGEAESLHSATPYYPWRAVLSSVLGLDETATPEEQRAHLRRLAEDQPWERLLPLLDDILTVGMADNPLTTQITGTMRAVNLREVVTGLLAAAARQGPLAIVLEDVHWMDSASLALATVVAQRVQPLLLVVSSRPLTGTRQGFLDPLLTMAGARHLRLEVLSREDCLQLAAQRLGVRGLAPAVADLIAGKSQGNPYFAVELAITLREHHLITVAGDECRPAGNLDIAAVKFPDSVHGLIMRRMDSLDATVQITAKVASVIGRNFSAPLIRRAFPLENDAPQVERNLEVLRRERLVAPSAEQEYTFSHALVEEAIYDRLLLTQRRTLHERVARALEEEAEESETSAVPLLAWHWARAGDHEKAGCYYGKAGQRAVQTGAYREALTFLNRALELAGADPVTADEILHVGQWHAMRAEALFGLGQLDESAGAFREAVRVLGHPVSDPLPPATLLQQATIPLEHGLAGASGVAPAECARVETLAACYEMLCLLDLFANRMAASLGAALESLLHARELGLCAAYARGLATMALATSLAPARALARGYAQAAIAAAQELGQEATTSRVREFLGMYGMGEGDWEATAEHFRRAIEGFRIVGDRRREIECTCLLSTWHHYRGRFAERVVLGQRVFDLALTTGDLQAQAWGLLDQLESLLTLGEFERATALGADLRRHLGQNIYGADEIMAYGLLAVLELRLDHLDEALTLADRALAVMNAVSPTIVYNLDAYAGVVEVYLEAWRRRLPRGAESRAREACRGLRRFARVFRMGTARALLLTARLREAGGDAAWALRLTRRALATAVRFAMPYDEALACRQLARLLPAGPEAESALSRARELFTTMSACYDLQATEPLDPEYASYVL